MIKVSELCCNSIYLIFHSNHSSSPLEKCVEILIFEGKFLFEEMICWLFSLSFLPFSLSLDSIVSSLIGTSTSSGNINGIGTNALLKGPYGVKISSDNSFALITDQGNSQIRKIITSTLEVSLFAGGSTYGSINGIGTNALFNGPGGVFISSSGSYAIITDSGNNQIRKLVISSSQVSLLAGGRGGITSGNTNGFGTNALFYRPYGISISPMDSFALIVDSLNHQVRKLIISTSEVSLLAGSSSGFTNGFGTNAKFYYPDGVDISPDGNYALIADTSNDQIRKLILSTNEVSTLTGRRMYGSTNGIGSNALFYVPVGVSISPLGDYALITDLGNHQIRKLILSTVEVSLLAGGVSSGSTNGVGTNVFFNWPTGLSISPDGSYALVADSDNNQISEIAIPIPDSTVSTFVGSSTGSTGSTNGIGSNVLFGGVESISLSPDGSYGLIADTNNHQIRKVIISTGEVSLLVDQLNNPVDVDISSDGSYAFFTDFSTNQIHKLIISTAEVSLLAGGVISGSTNGIGTNALFNGPYGISISSDGSYVIVTDYSGNQIRKVIILTSEVSLLAGGGSLGSANGIGSNALFNNPARVSISSDGSYALIADSNNNQIRKLIITTNEVSLLTGGVISGSTNGVGTNVLFNGPLAIDISPDGSYGLIGDSGNNQIRKLIISTGEVSLFAGNLGTTQGMVNGIGTTTLFFNPIDIDISSDGNFALISDQGNNQIRKIIIFSISPSLPLSHSSSSPSLTFTPTISPTTPPSPKPTFPPTFNPTFNPTKSQTFQPSFTPSKSPTLKPSFQPSKSPTYKPTFNPTILKPTLKPTFSPSLKPTYKLTQSKFLPTQSPSK